MRNGFKAIVAASVLGATSLAAVAPAQARDHGGAAVVAGIIGLGIGAAIASDSHRGYDRGYDQVGYYGNPGYGYGYDAPAYYAPGYAVTYGYDDYRGHDWRRDERRRERYDGYDSRGYDRGWRR